MSPTADDVQTCPCGGQIIRGPFWIKACQTAEEPSHYPPQALVPVTHCRGCGLLYLPAMLRDEDQQQLKPAASSSKTSTQAISDQIDAKIQGAKDGPSYRERVAEALGLEAVHMGTGIDFVGQILDAIEAAGTADDWNAPDDPHGYRERAITALRGMQV